MHLNSDVLFELLSHLDDPIFLWTTCRTVSSEFKDAAERVFLHRYLPDSALVIELRNKPQSRQAPLPRLHAVFTFSHLFSSNRSLAIFHDKLPTPTPFPSLFLTRLRETMHHGNPPSDPRIHVHMCREINDTHVPGLEADWERLEVRCDWRGLVTEFIREQKEFERRHAVELESYRRRLFDSSISTQDSGISTEDPYLSGITTFHEWMDLDEVPRKLIRRERIRRNKWEFERIEWSDDMLDWEVEERALGRLKVARTEMAWNEQASECGE